jgi:hypothetical protein
MKRNIKVSNNKILLNGDLLKSFDFEIKEFVEFENVILVCLNYFDVPFNENIFALDYNGRIIWQISKYTPIEGTKSSFVGLNKESENSCWAVNWDGTSLLLDVNTGNILKDKWVR